MTYNVASSQARIIINNQSQRDMTVKIMKDDLAGNASLHSHVYIKPFSRETIYFSQTGYYFTKTKASMIGKEPIYRKGDSFKVYNGSDGYSVLELTYSIEESDEPVATGGKNISKREFDKDN
jgi:hypothetical protein